MATTVGIWLSLVHVGASMQVACTSSVCCCVAARPAYVCMYNQAIYGAWSGGLSAYLWSSSVTIAYVCLAAASSVVRVETYLLGT